MLKKCFNPKVLIILGIVAVGVLVIAPKAFFAALPLLLLAACPLSMIVMMSTMSKQQSNQHKPDNDANSTKRVNDR